MNRRDFLKGLLAGAGAASLPQALRLLGPEPERRIWQVSRQAPVPARLDFDAYLWKANADFRVKYEAMYDDGERDFWTEFQPPEHYNFRSTIALGDPLFVDNEMLRGGKIPIGVVTHIDERTGDLELATHGLHAATLKVSAEEARNMPKIKSAGFRGSFEATMSPDDSRRFEEFVSKLVLGDVR